MRNMESFPAPDSPERERVSERDLDRILSMEVFPRPRMEDFEGVYGKEEIARDREYVLDLEDRFRRYGERRDPADLKQGEALEAIVPWQIDLRGPVVRTTRYDDIANGIDAVWEIETQDEREGRIRRAALGIDVSTSKSGDFIERKVRKNIAELRNPQSRREVKYFASDLTDFRGRLFPVVPVVLGVSGEGVQGLFRDVLALDEARLRKDAERSNALQKRIGRHPVQQVFLREMLLQLDVYASLNLPDEKLMKEVSGIRALVHDLILERREQGILLEDFGKDRVLDIIERIAYGVPRAS